MLAGRWPAGRDEERTSRLRQHQIRSAWLSAAVAKHRPCLQEPFRGRVITADDPAQSMPQVPTVDRALPQNPTMLGMFLSKSTRCRPVTSFFCDSPRKMGLKTYPYFGRGCLSVPGNQGTKYTGVVG